MRQGRVAEAEQLYRRVLEAQPDNVEALNVLALSALRARQLPEAGSLLNRAAAAHPNDPVTQHHLGRVMDAAGNTAGAVAAHARAVSLAPDFHVARLHLAAALERSSQGADAPIQYARALNDAQAQGRWLNTETTPPPLRPLLQQAVRAVREGRRASFARLLDPLMQRYGRSELARVEQCIRIYLREEAPVRTDERQQPTFLFFPGLGASPYLDRSRFTWIDALEADTGVILEELMLLLPDSAGRERVFGSEELERDNLRGLDRPPSWNGYYFYRHGIRREDNCTSCPATARALDRLPLVHLREHGPEVLYSVFTPGTHLLPHRGVTNTRLVGHLPLIVPENCALNVGGELHHWQPGKVVVFDDTYEHEAWNRSTQTRVVMIFDVWHPGLSEAERAAVIDLVGAIGDFRKAMEAA